MVADEGYWREYTITAIDQNGESISVNIPLKECYEEQQNGRNLVKFTVSENGSPVLSFDMCFQEQKDAIVVLDGETYKAWEERGMIPFIENQLENVINEMIQNIQLVGSDTGNRSAALVANFRKFREVAQKFKENSR